MPGRSGVTVVTNSCVCFFTHEAAGALSARHSLRPLLSRGEWFLQNLGRIAPRDRGCTSGNGDGLGVSRRSNEGVLCRDFRRARFGAALGGEPGGGFGGHKKSR